MPGKPLPGEPLPGEPTRHTSEPARPQGGRNPAPRTAVIACGALAQPTAAIAGRRGWVVDVVPLPPLLHNHPEKIASEVRKVASQLSATHDRIVIGYADCGTYGALDRVCSDLGIDRLPGLHCYDVFGGAGAMEQLFADQPGTYVLTDFLARSFHRSVWVELGLDRHPELHEAYFAHYTRVVWLAQEPDDAELHGMAQAAAQLLRLPLRVVPTGHRGLESALESLLTASP
ncbi:MAG: DUF1638 domain-containing protein [Ornithinimicrobium sp.]